jgi:hypothetical protein
MAGFEDIEPNPRRSRKDDGREVFFEGAKVGVSCKRVPFEVVKFGVKGKIG